MGGVEERAVGQLEAGAGPGLDLTVAKHPGAGRTLVVIDTSGSMRAAVSGRSNMARVEVAAVMALATAKRAKDVDVVIYGQSNALVRGLDATSVLGGVAKAVASVGSVGHATYGHIGDRPLVRRQAAPPRGLSSQTTSSTTRARSTWATCR